MSVPTQDEAILETLARRVVAGLEHSLQTAFPDPTAKRVRIPRTGAAQ